MPGDWRIRLLDPIICGVTRRVVFAVLLAALLISPLRATIVVPLTLDEMVAAAETIVVGMVVGQRADWRTDASGRRIVTEVTIQVEGVLKGASAGRVTIEFLGGRIAGEVMRVDGMPEFAVGDRDILFLARERTAISPVVGFNQGRFRVEGPDLAHGRIYTNNHWPLPGAASRPVRALTVGPGKAAPMTYPEFEALVTRTRAWSPAR